MRKSESRQSGKSKSPLGFAKLDDDINFMPWECLSFLRSNSTTLDFVIPNRENMMILQSVAVMKLYGKELHAILMQ